MNKKIVATNEHIRSATSSPCPDRNNFGVVSNLEVPRPSLGLTGEDYERDLYRSTYPQDPPGVKVYEYGLPSNHDEEDYRNSPSAPRWCEKCFGINIETNCRNLHPYSLTIAESVPPARPNVLKTTIPRVSTYVDNDTWSTPSSDEYYGGNDPTTIVKCKECKDGVPYADMVREICHRNCDHCKMRFSNAASHAIVQCEIISIKLSRDDIADIFQCKVC